MALNVGTLRPGLLVSLKTSIMGNVSYEKRTIEEEHTTADGEKVSRWETTRAIADPDEHEEATRVRGKVRSAIAGVCASSSFGLLCPANAAEKLEGAIAEGRRLKDEFNGRARLTRIALYVIVGQIAADDVEAVRAINSEVRDLMADMEDGIKNCDVKIIRDAANKAKSIGQMLSPTASARVEVAIEAARSAARRIKAAIGQAAVVIDQASIKTITDARTAFLDFDEAVKLTVRPAVVAVAIDLVPGERVHVPGEIS